MDAAIRLRDFVSVSMVFLRVEMLLEYVVLRYPFLGGHILALRYIPEVLSKKRSYMWCIQIVIENDSHTGVFRISPKSFLL